MGGAGGDGAFSSTSSRLRFLLLGGDALRLRLAAPAALAVRRRRLVGRGLVVWRLLDAGI